MKSLAWGGPMETGAQEAQPKTSPDMNQRMDAPKSIDEEKRRKDEARQKSRKGGVASKLKGLVKRGGKEGGYDHVGN